ncbi:PREDICTED: splicing factor, arginine/serine-rich 15-like [Lupinus angustifolius]|nr:PREDICTED: splicing factor, arginine/serine-rich 15-like [Lupinus angustifolius]XP_019435689.1 PREDICTED: splicing factor, arginine/serine-rich 15-like [Lupinus angustifolius]
MNVLRNIHGVYNITIDGDQGIVKVSGKVNPSTLLGVLEKYGRHGEIKFIKFDGEVVQTNPHNYGYHSYGMKGSSYPPPLGCPQPPPPPPPYRGPPPPPRPYGPSFLGPYWPPPPPSHDPRGGMQNKVLVTEKNHCAIM